MTTREMKIGNAAKYILSSVLSVLEARDNGIVKRFLSFLLIGAPGIGKTAVTKMLEKALQVAVKGIEAVDTINIVVFSTQVLKPEDIRGLPTLVNGEALWIAYGNLQKLIDANDRNIVICLFEDLGQALTSVKAACMQVLDGWVNEHRLNLDAIVFMANTNDVCHNAGVKGFIDPLLTRFTCAIHVVHDTRYWLSEVAPKIGIHKLVIAYVGHMLINQAQDVLNDIETSKGFIKRCAPRTWHQMSDVLHVGLPSEHDIEGEDLNVISSVIGTKEANAFFAFIQIAPKALNPHSVLASPGDCELPTEMGILHMIAAGCAEIVDSDTADAFIVFVDRLPRQLQSFAVKQAISRRGSLASAESIYQWRFREENKELMIGA